MIQKCKEVGYLSGGYYLSIAANIMKIVKITTKKNGRVQCFVWMETFTISSRSFKKNLWIIIQKYKDAGLSMGFAWTCHEHYRNRPCESLEWSVTKKTRRVGTFIIGMEKKAWMANHRWEILTRWSQKIGMVMLLNSLTLGIYFVLCITKLIWTFVSTVIGTPNSWKNIKIIVIFNWGRK